MMKKYNFLMLLLTILFACNEQLDLEPISEIGENGFFNDAEDVEAALIGAYDGLQNTIQREILIIENRSDNGFVNLGSGGDYTAVETFDDQAVSSVITAYWGDVYNAISRVNLVLNYAEIVDQEDRRNQIEGEARFLRAYYYFKLVRLFGEVPLLLNPVAPEDKESLVRKPTAEIYNAIIADLEFGAENLSPTSSEKRPSGLVAKAMLGKVYLTLGDHNSAKAFLEDVINSAAYSLQSGYEDVFDINNELNDEILFAIQFKSGANGEGNGFSYEMTSKSPIGAVRPTNDFINQFEASDSRINLVDVTNVFSLKYVNSNAAYDGENDWPVLRYADVLLMYGEVLNELNGPTQAALDYLNETRLRAGLTALTTADISTQEDYQAAVIKERRLELAFENQRWFDLMRTNTALEVMQAHGSQLGFQVQSFRLLFPIPQREIDTSGGIITQNPGY